MPTSVRPVQNSIAPRIASPVGGFRSSVPTIKSSSVRMISIGPEGGRARVDTTINNPFAGIRPANPNLNPTGKIFGENGPSRPSGLERPNIPVRGSMDFKRPSSNPHSREGHSTLRAEPSGSDSKSGNPANKIEGVFNKRSLRAYALGSPTRSGIRSGVSFTPEAFAKADVDATFAKARERNHAQLEARKVNDAKTAEALITSALPNVRTPNPNRAIDFKGFQNLPQVKEPDQEKASQNSKVKSRLPNFPYNPNSETITRPTPKISLTELNTDVVKNVLARREVIKEMPEPLRFVRILRDWRNLPIEAISTNRLVRTIGIAEDRRQVPDRRMRMRLKKDKTESAIQPLVEGPQVQPLPKLTIEQVRSFTALRPLVDKDIITEDQAMQRAGVISSPPVEMPQAVKEVKLVAKPKIEGLSAKQADILVTMAPIIREGTPAAKEQVYQSTGINQELAQRFIQELGNVKQNTLPQAEIVPQPQEQAALQQALQVVRLPDWGVLTGVESETEIKKRALALIGVIRQTQQLSALGNTEIDNAQLVERQLAELVPQKMRSRVSSFLVKMIKQAVIENPAEDSAKNGLHQVDLKTQNKRVKVVTKGIDTAPQNEAGQIDRDYVIDQVRADKESKLSGLARQLKQNFDGSRDYLLIAMQKVQKWVSPQELAQIADNAMYDRPAVESAEKQSTRAVGRKEVGTVMDPMWAEMIKSLIKTLIINPQQIPART